MEDNLEKRVEGHWKEQIWDLLKLPLTRKPITIVFILFYFNVEGLGPNRRVIYKFVSKEFFWHPLNWVSDIFIFFYNDKYYCQNFKNRNSSFW